MSLHKCGHMNRNFTYISNITNSLATTVAHHKQAIWVISIMFSLVVATCAATIYFVYKHDPSKFNEKIYSYQRDYEENPFGINDAIAACRAEASLKLGSELKNTVVDDLSTRFDTARGIFFVALNAGSVTAHKNDQQQIYCHVDPKDYLVSYFKTHGAKRRQFKLSFF